MRFSVSEALRKVWKACLPIPTLATAPPRQHSWTNLAPHFSGAPGISSPSIGRWILTGLCIPVCPQKNLSLKDSVTLVSPPPQPKWLHVSRLKVLPALLCLCSLASLSLQITDPVELQESRKTRQLPATTQCKLCAEVGDWLVGFSSDFFTELSCWLISFLFVFLN